mmetsp:Transcript_67325/g.160960  ORF Transcript_67325/g.160960 Transcript_67325/m.160960 type:complete len:271 (+) Transcript_67325:132-944(+)
MRALVTPPSGRQTGTSASLNLPVVGRSTEKVMTAPSAPTAMRWASSTVNRRACRLAEMMPYFLQRLWSSATSPTAGYGKSITPPSAHPTAQRVVSWLTSAELISEQVAPGGQAPWSPHPKTALLVAQEMSRCCTVLGSCRPLGTSQWSSSAAVQSERMNCPSPEKSRWSTAPEWPVHVPTRRKSWRVSYMSTTWSRHAAARYLPSGDHFMWQMSSTRCVFLRTQRGVESRVGWGSGQSQTVKRPAVCPIATSVSSGEMATAVHGSPTLTD